MNEAFVTFQGWVGQRRRPPRDRRRATSPTSGSGRTPADPQAQRRTGWTAPTSWFSVTCWRTLADHVRDSVRKGDPVLVHGRLRTDVWEREDGRAR